jgi:hypothetical protein
MRISSIFFVVLTGITLALSQSPDDDVTYVFPDEHPQINLTDWKRAVGDSMQWRLPEYNDSAWVWDNGWGVWANTGGQSKEIRWYRKAVFFPEPLDTLVTMAIYQVALVSANEIFWDGVPVARNGIPGSSYTEEKTGLSAQVFLIPRELTTAGKHCIAIRASNFHAFSGVIDSPLQLGTFSALHLALIRHAALALFLAGVFLITAMFHSALLAGQGNRLPYALFSCFCFSCGAYIIIQSMLHYFQIDLRYYYLLAGINDVPWFCMMALLPIFFLFQFTFRYRNHLAIAIAAIALTVVLLPRLVTFNLVPAAWLVALVQASQLHTYATFAFSLILTLVAVRERKTGSLTAAAGVVAFSIGVLVTYNAQVENGWALGFAVLILFMTLSLSRQMAQRKIQHEEAQLRSARLELELLKKHIQPHFLLNSLNSIVAWLEEDPPVAARLVNALADELRMLLNFSGRSRITLDEELRLCRAHLQVMSLRQEKEFALQVEGVCGNEKLPPLIIHTLIENGLTHGYSGRRGGTFVVRCLRRESVLALTLSNDGASAVGERALQEGTGLRYVKSRLEEAFPGRWALQSGPVDGGWSVTIEVKE